ncbi:unnamed protein product [Linum trigynum]|uniref:Uncharacterized protein n=1 Tax=Linum trigynum TaxID=586398 RepID=A0AAV2FQY0_9ROSI
MEHIRLTKTQPSLQEATNLERRWSICALGVYLILVFTVKGIRGCFSCSTNPKPSLVIIIELHAHHRGVVPTFKKTT